VEGSGIRIITGCVAHPTAGGDGLPHFNQELVDDLAVNELDPRCWCASRLRTADASSSPSSGLSPAQTPTLRA
jgi:hypothetical protein